MKNSLEEIKREITTILDKEKIEFCFIKDNLSLWDIVEKEFEYIPYFYSSIRNKIYNETLKNEIEDVSLFIMENSNVIGIWPLSYSIENQNINLSTYLQNILMPLFSDKILVRQKNSLIKKTLNFLFDLTKLFNINKFYTSEVFSNNFNNIISEWHDKSISRGAQVLVEYDLYIDLSLKIDQIRSYFRKSYKPLISRGIKELGSDVLINPDYEKFMEFKKLHEKVSGRKTRSDYTWELQFEELKKNRCFIAYVYNKNNKEMIGGGLFSIVKNECAYVSGAYIKKENDLPLGHTVQYVAINEMKKRKNIIWYKIGEKAFKSSNIANSEKDFSISKFKEGFATNIFPHFVLKHDLEAV